jgi:hypothetical protein
MKKLIAVKRIYAAPRERRLWTATSAGVQSSINYGCTSLR